MLDFGLAKMWEFGAASPMSNSPTVVGATTAGVLMGTAAYMSPEQARGKTVDRSADVWAFACVLYEMLTGQRAFDGETVTDILGAIVKSEPDWNALPRTVPPHVRRLLKRCLQKDRRHRLRDAGAVALELEEPGDDLNAGSKPASTFNRAAAWFLAGALIFSAIVAVAVIRLRSVPETTEIRLEFNTPPTTDEISLAVSPDGQKLVFVGVVDNQPKLLLRSLESLTVQPLAGTEGASYPFWSPDSRSIAFFADGQLKRIELSGGSARSLTSTSPGRGGSWNRNGVIIFAGTDGPLWRVSETGGESTALTRVEAPKQLNHRFPQFLPDDRHFLFYVRGAPGAQGVYVGSLDEPQMKRLLDSDAGFRYSSGYLFFIRQSTLFAQRFELDRLELTGNPFPVAQQVSADPSGLGAPLSAAVSGVLAYRLNTSAAERHFVWFDRMGKELQILGDPDSAGPLHPELSADGRKLAIRRSVNSNVDIWLLETGRGIVSRFTSDAAVEDYPVWSPDGKQIVFQSNRAGSFDLYQKSTNGEGTEQLLLASPKFKSPMDWSRDGRFLLYRVTDPKTGYDIWALPMQGDKTPFPIVQTDFEERDAQFSPDGKWIAYQSTESGRFEIYVQAFPKTTGKSRISTNGGTQVRWRGDSKELFYISLDGQMMAVPIRLDSAAQTVDPGTPSLLFRARIVGGAVQGVNRQQYVASPDGQRFLINTPTKEAATSSIALILNWKPPQK